MGRHGTKRDSLKAQAEGEFFTLNDTLTFLWPERPKTAVVPLSGSQKELVELRTSFDAMAVQHDSLAGVVGIVCDQLGAV